MNRSKSTWLISISIALFVLISLSAFVIVYLTRNIEQDANDINNAGIIRGTIQRITKLEISGNNSDELIKQVDSSFESFLIDKTCSTKDIESFRTSMKNLQVCWEDMKSKIYTYRTIKSDEAGNQLIDKSEEIWKKANSMVKTTQLISERKVSYFYFLLTLFGLNLLILFVIIISLKLYVKDKLEFASLHDMLTGAYNRRFFSEYLTNMIKTAERTSNTNYRNAHYSDVNYNNTFSIIMLDIDHFKNVNDTYGHDKGDYVLKELVNIISKSIRQNDLYFRVGGEEFAVLLPDTELQGALKLAEKIRELAEAYVFSEIDNITVSLGVAQYNKGDNENILFKKADEALYKAKRNGRNRIESVNN